MTALEFQEGQLEKLRAQSASDAIERLSGWVEDDRSPEAARMHSLMMMNEPERYARLLPYLITTAKRHALGCRICSALPNASGHVEHPVIGTICRRCERDLNRHVRDLIDERLDAADQRRRETASEWIKKREQRHDDIRARQLAVFAVSEKHPGLVKIGTSVDPDERYVRQLGLRVIATERGGMERERELHFAFRAHRVPVADLPGGLPEDGRTEWFVLAPEIQNYVAQLQGAAA